MDKKEVLQTRIRKLEEKLGVSYADTKYADQINSSEKLLLYKYVKLLQADDKNKELHMTEKEIRKVFALENIKKQGRELSEDQEEFLSGSTEIFYEHKAKLDEYDKTVEDYEASEDPIRPLTEEDIETIVNHAEDLEGIVDVNADLIQNFEGDINKFLGIEEEQIDADGTQNTTSIIHANEEAFGENFEDTADYDTGALASVTVLDEKTFDVDEEMTKIRAMQKIKEALLKKFELASNIKNYDMNRDTKEKEIARLMDEVANNPTLENVERIKCAIGKDINTLCCGVAAEKAGDMLEAQNVADSFNKFDDMMYGQAGEILEDIMSELVEGKELSPELVEVLNDEIIIKVTEYDEKIKEEDEASLEDAIAKGLDEAAKDALENVGQGDLGFY